jgi:predicted  nucleic acid-binding Zn-ribbon protein
MDEAEKLDKVKEQVIEADRKNEKKLEILEAQIKERVFENKLELAELDSELNELMTSVPEEWINKLARIADSHNGVGIAQIKSGCCGACHVSLAESLLQRAKRGEDQILLCENCGRIIFY